MTDRSIKAADAYFLQPGADQRRHKWKQALLVVLPWRRPQYCLVALGDRTSGMSGYRLAMVLQS
jgi:hypothetical protein